MIILNAHGYTAWIDPNRGGSCIRLARFGAEALRTPLTPQDYQTSPFLYGTSLLFPPNRIANGCFLFDGRTYELPVNEPSTGCFLHGTLHETPMDIVCCSDTTVALQYRATADRPYLTFPHAFTLQLSWHLTEEGLLQKAVFINDSALNMPVALAFHTTFNVPPAAGSNAEQITLTLDTSREFSRDMTTYLPDGRSSTQYPDRKSMQEGAYFPSRHCISRFFRMGDRKEMILTDRQGGVRVVYSAKDPYDYWMVYNGGNPDFLCVEPQSWLSNCPNAPFPRAESGFDFLPPGQQRCYETRLAIEKC